MIKKIRLNEEHWKKKAEEVKLKMEDWKRKTVKKGDEKSCTEKELNEMSGTEKKENEMKEKRETVEEWLSGRDSINQHYNFLFNHFWLFSLVHFFTSVEFYFCSNLSKSPNLNKTS